MKLVLFNILGSKSNGTGHLYRSISLAKDINSKNKIIFLTNKRQNIAIRTLKNSKYQFYCYSQKKIFNKILSHKPSVVINDILSTKKKDIKLLKYNGIDIINFEDLGSGNLYADLTINEIFQRPNKNYNKILWGEKYFFLRDEFLKQKKNKFKKIKNILLFFGGTDPNDLTLKTLKSIYSSSLKQNLKLNIITGIGYKNQKNLKKFIKNKKNINLIENTKKISKYMNNCQIAFTSNGRTTYELAHMNLPSIVISHNNRETQHKFATFKNGFINLGKFSNKSFSFKNLNYKFNQLVVDIDLYQKLYNSMLKINFSLGRQRVKNEINKINKIFL